jgi:HK97 family phage major capsid protein
MSRLLTLQSNPDAGDVIATDLTRKIRRAIEAAAFNGSGINGQPKGILNTTGVGTVSGTSFALSTVASAVTDIGDALDPDMNPGWAASKATAILLRQRQEFTGGTRALWEGPATEGTIADYAAAASSGVPSATAIFGAWKYLTLVDFGGGLVVSVNPFGGNAYGGGPDAANFQRGIIGMRFFAVLDVGVVWPSAFAAVTGVT